MAEPRTHLTRSLVKNKPLVITLAILALILTAVLVVWINLPWRPDVTPFHTDSGFYAYFGKAILHGEIPYRDVWDDKPPLGYYLNALGLAIFGQNSWGVWWAGVAWIFGCTVLFFLVIRKLFGNLTAGIASVLFLLALMNPQLFEGANLMEVYALAPQIAIIGITYLFFTNQRHYWFAILVGFVTAFSFLIKQPTVVLGGVSVLMMVISSFSDLKIREIFKIVGGFLFGFLDLIVLVSIYWLSVGAFSQFIDGALLQGFSFMGGQQSHLREYFFYALVNVLPTLLLGKLYLLALITGGIFLLEKLYLFWLKPIFKARLSVLDWCFILVFILAPWIAKGVWPGQYIGKFALISVLALGLFILVKFYRLKSKPPAGMVFTTAEWTWLMALFALPLEVLMASLGGRYFGHYFISLLPALVLAIAYPVWRGVSALSQVRKSKGVLLKNGAYMLIALGTLVWGGFSFAMDRPSAAYLGNLAGIFRNQVLLNDLERYVVRTTQPGDEVLVWHIHLGINFNTDRSAPSRFLFPLNLFIPPSAQNTKLEQYVNDLEDHPPALILVQRVSSLALPFVDQPIEQECATYCTPEFEQALQVPEIRQQWLRFQQFFESRYALDNTIYDWKVYRKLP